MKKILLIYTDSLVLNIPRSGNILTAHPGYLYLTVLQNAISGINFYTLKTLKLLINDLAKTSAPAGGTWQFKKQSAGKSGGFRKCNFLNKFYTGLNLSIWLGLKPIKKQKGAGVAWQFWKAKCREVWRFLKMKFPVINFYHLENIEFID